jgi:hypothetical protein
VVTKNRAMSASATTRAPARDSSQRRKSAVAGVRTAKATALYAMSVTARIRQAATKS